MKNVFFLIFILTSFVKAKAQNVGIGTTAPAAQLDVHGTANLVSRFNTTTNAMYLAFAENTVNRGYIGSYSGAAEDVDFGTTTNNTTGKIHFTTQTSPRMTIDHTGNVGIGTTTPAYKLDVAGRLRLKHGAGTAGIYFDGLTQPTRSFIGTYNDDYVGIYGSGNNTWNFLMNVNNGNIGIGNTDPQHPLSFGNIAGSKISFWDDVNGNYGVGLQNNLLQMHTNGSFADIAFGYGSSAAFTETMRIRGNGNVGIGTTDPAYKLDVAGRLRLKHGAGTAGIYFDGLTQPTRSFIGTYNDDYVGIYGSGNNTWNFLMNVNNGNIGIGNTDPQHPLSFGNIAGSKISFWDDVNGNYGVGLQNNLLQMHTNGSFADIAFGYGSSAAFTETMRIKGNGNVGIGTTTPAATLDVHSTVNLTSNYNSTTNAMYNTYAEGGTVRGYIGSYTGAAEDFDLGTTTNNTTGKLHFTTQASPKMTIDNTGNVGIGTTNPTATLEVDGYTKLGSDAPAIKTKFLTRTITAIDGTAQSINHGLYAEQILSLTVHVTFTSTEGLPSFVGPNYTGAPGLQFEYNNIQASIRVFPKPGNSSGLLNQTMKVFIVYKDL